MSNMTFSFYYWLSKPRINLNSRILKPPNLPSLDVVLHVTPSRCLVVSCCINEPVYPILFTQQLNIKLMVSV